MAETTSERVLRRNAEKEAQRAKIRRLPPKKVAWGMLRRQIMKLDVSDTAINLYIGRSCKGGKSEKIRTMIETARDSLIAKIDKSLGAHIKEATKGFETP